MHAEFLSVLLVRLRDHMHLLLAFLHAGLAAYTTLKGVLISLSRIDGHVRSRLKVALARGMPQEIRQVRTHDLCKLATILTASCHDQACSLATRELDPRSSEKKLRELFDMIMMKQAQSFGLTSIYTADTKPTHTAVLLAICRGIICERHHSFYVNVCACASTSFCRKAVRCADIA